MEPVIRSRKELDRAIEQIRARFKDSSAGSHELKLAPATAQLPTFTLTTGVRAKIARYQAFIKSFQYNHVGPDFVPVEKSRPFSRLIETARLIVRESLPIKCLEAVALGVYLTRDLETVVRFPLRFQSEVDGQTHWHIVLALRHEGKFGAIGISRRATLDHKDFEYDSLGALVLAYRQAYEDVGHRVIQVRSGCDVACLLLVSTDCSLHCGWQITIGLPFGRNPHSNERVYWHFVVAQLLAPDDWSRALILFDKVCPSVRTVLCG